MKGFDRSILSNHPESTRYDIYHTSYGTFLIPNPDLPVCMPRIRAPIAYPSPFSRVHRSCLLIFSLYTRLTSATIASIGFRNTDFHGPDFPEQCAGADAQRLGRTYAVSRVFRQKVCNQHFFDIMKRR